MILLCRRWPVLVRIIVRTASWWWGRVFLWVIRPVLRSRRGRELSPTLCPVAVHPGALVVLAVKAAATLVVPPATQAATQTSTQTAAEALHTAASPLTPLLSLVVGIVVAAVAGVLARRGALSPFATVASLLAFTPLVKYRTAIGLRFGVFLVLWRKEAARNRFKDLVWELFGAVIQRFQGEDRHAARRANRLQKTGCATVVGC